MNIALIGYGRMGKEIEKIALERGHRIVLKIDKNNIEDFKSNDFANNTDVAIEFSQPESAVNNYKECFKHSIPVVSGTTGWLSDFEEIKVLCENDNQTFFYASNFSLGVNIFFEINKKLAALINGVDGYEVDIEEIHHTKKLDEPSGTAITLANQLVSELSTKEFWQLNGTESKAVNIKAKRIADVPGTHIVKYESDIDQITIEHKAKNRKGFALGAVLAAEFLQGKKGIYTMQDLLKL